MSSKRAMRQAQKQAYAKHRSNITNSRFELKKKFITKNKEEKKIKQRPIIIMEGILLLHYIRLHKFYTLKSLCRNP